MNRSTLLAGCSGVMLLAIAGVSAQAKPSRSCEMLSHLKLAEATQIAAQAVPAGPFTLPGTAEVLAGGDLPAFCRVQLTVAPQINIEVWLPRDTWNKRYRAEGGRYYVGSISYDRMAGALRAGYATASTDTGHAYSAAELADQRSLGAKVGDFGLNPDRSLNDYLIRDFAQRSLFELAVKPKRIIRVYYGEAPRYSYWHGCSTGGREGLLAVQRFPEQYDGVLAGCPAINWDRFIPAGLWPQTVMQQEVGRAIDPVKLEAVAKAAVSACDQDDGVVDGIINDPRKCRYDPAAMACREGDESSATCLSSQEVIAIRKIWEGPSSARTGERLWFGLERGASFAALAGSRFGDSPHGVAHFKWIKQDPHFNWRSLSEADYEQSLRESREKFGEMLATDRADLSGFRRRGGKVLIFHGESDDIIFPRGTLHYFDRVQAANGGAEAVHDFARLFMLPGFGHACRSNDRAPFPDGLFAALVDWVEKGIAPDHVIASQRLPDGAVRTRPLCAYPSTAKWSGQGSSNDAANFVCVDGRHDPRDFMVAEPAVPR